MKTNCWKSWLSSTLLILCGAVGAGWFLARPVAGQETAPPGLHGAAAVAQLKEAGQYDSLQSAMQQARLSVSRVAHSPLGRAAWHAPNPVAGYDAYVTESGVSSALRSVCRSMYGFVVPALAGKLAGFPAEAGTTNSTRNCKLI